MQQADIDDDYEEEEIPSLIEIPADSGKTIPITILSGFLGSGKTTLLNYILTKQHGKRIAVIENEFSSGLGIEGMIAKSGVNGDNLSNFFELNNGCICCTVKDDLIQTLEQLVLHKDRFDYILIETTGMANPGPLITSFWTDNQLGSYLKLDGVICVVDSANILTYLSSPDISFEVKQQLCYADRILLNKADLVNEEQMKIVEDKIHTINNFALTERSTYTAINLDFVLATDSYSSSSTKAQDPLSIFGFNASVQCFPCVDQKLPSMPSHQSLPSPPVESSSHPTSSITSLGFEFLNLFDFQTIRKVLDEILYNNGSSDMKIYRMKGLLKIHGQSNFFILQAVHNLFELDESTYVVDSGDSSSTTSRVIIIGSNLNQIFLEERLKSALVVS